MKISSEEILLRLVLPESDFQGCQVFELSKSFGQTSYFPLCLFGIPPNAFISCGECNFYANCRLNQSCCSLDFGFYQINKDELKFASVNVFSLVNYSSIQDNYLICVLYWIVVGFNSIYLESHHLLHRFH